MDDAVKEAAGGAVQVEERREREEGGDLGGFVCGLWHAVQSIRCIEELNFKMAAAGRGFEGVSLTLVKAEDKRVCDGSLQRNRKRE